VALKGSIDPANDRNPQKPSLKVSSIADIAALIRSAARKLAAGEDPPMVSSMSAGEEQPEAVATPAFHVRLDTTVTSSDEGIYILRNFVLENPGPCPIFIHVSADSEKIIRANAGISHQANPSICAGVTEVWKE
jgi:hypothetical protein